MPKRMLIDASHPEETRVVVLDGNRVEEFDFEAASKRPLKGNIYLAKVTRVEPSLQAAFVEYGGNRQGFLAFSEIHPDYYQIPVADRMALLAAQAERAMADEDDEFDDIEVATVPAKKRVAGGGRQPHGRAGRRRCERSHRRPETLRPTMAKRKTMSPSPRRMRRPRSQGEALESDNDATSTAEEHEVEIRRGDG